MSVSIKPLEDRVVVKPLEAEQPTASGLVIPDTAKEKPQEGEVIAVGAGRFDDEGERVPMDVEGGENVVFSKYGGTGLKDGHDEGEAPVREGDAVRARRFGEQGRRPPLAVGVRHQVLVCQYGGTRAEAGHGAVHAPGLPDLLAVLDALRELGVMPRRSCTTRT